MARQIGQSLEYLHLSGLAFTHQPPRAIGVSANFSDQPGELHLFLVKLAGAGEVQTAVLNDFYWETEFVLQREVPFANQCFQFFRLGLAHIFLGYDHLLFLLALLVIGGRLSSLIKAVTLFTVALENFFVRSANHR